MKKLVRIYVVVLMTLVLGTSAFAVNPEIAVETVADYLLDNQNANGSWPGSADFTGSVVPGMTRAYQITGNTAYLASAQLAGNFILSIAGGNFLGDEAYALTRLSEVSTNPGINQWRTALGVFYAAVKNSEYGTDGYIDLIEEDQEDPSDALFFIAHHTVAAFYVDASDRYVWRVRLIEVLSRIQDGQSGYPVGSLGLAVWALVQTGLMDDTYVDPSAPSGSYWTGVKLNQLEGLLKGHIVLSGTFAGSAYWRFDHGNGGFIQDIAGYTEDSVFATKGFAALQKKSAGSVTEIRLKSVQDKLTAGIENDGSVQYSIFNNGQTEYVWAAETLAVLPILADANRDDVVNLADLDRMTNYWLAANCASSLNCAGTDINKDGKVNLADFAALSSYWLVEAN
ncbi:MAG: hypothetical protein JEZ07_08350 [Phycisphaerae bacterium]|nr:hypothetical protein [Phycisphaerae bacterium]